MISQRSEKSQQIALYGQLAIIESSKIVKDMEIVEINKLVNSDQLEGVPA